MISRVMYMARIAATVQRGITRVETELLKEWCGFCGINESFGGERDASVAL